MKKFKPCKRLRIHTLESGYSDPREVLLHAAFQTLEDLIHEKMFKMVDWKWNETQSAIYDEWMALHEWWTKIRPNRKDPFDDPECPELDMSQDMNGFTLWKTDEEHAKWSEFAKKSSEWEEACNKEDDEMLHRLINTRLYMWT